jgi:mono/diheme cytochrome c family protein
MKKALFLSGLIAIIVIACSRKTVASKEPVIPQRESSITPITNNTPPVSSTTVATDEATISLGKTVFESRCGRCHGLKNVSDYTEQRWDGILRTMAPRARLTETETQQVAAYVKASAKK